MISEIFQISGIVIAVCVGISVLIGNVYYVIRSKNSKIQKEEIAILREEIAMCESKHQESQKDIHRLQGQIDVLKDIPLKDINQDIGSIKKTNEKILKTLQDSENVQEKIHRVQKEVSA